MISKIRSRNLHVSTFPAGCGAGWQPADRLGVPSGPGPVELRSTDSSEYVTVFMNIGTTLTAKGSQSLPQARLAQYGECSLGPWPQESAASPAGRTALVGSVLCSFPIKFPQLSTLCLTRILIYEYD